MTTEIEHTVITPTSDSPNFDAVQVVPFDQTRVQTVAPTSNGQFNDVTLADGTQLVVIFVDIDSTDRLPLVYMARGDGDGFWPLASGYHNFGVVEGARVLHFWLPGAGSATVKVMEA